MIKAIVFDADGTLLNTPEVIMAAYAHVAEVHGLRAPSQAEIMEHMGKALHEIYQGLYPDLSDVQHLLVTNNEFVLKHLQQINGFAGLQDMMQDLQGMGLKLALITGGNAKVHQLLEHNGVEQYFGSVVHSDRIQNQKPDPEGLLLALSEIDIDPKDAVMVGDMRYDILAGKNAGVHTTIGLTHGFGTIEELKEAGADYIVDNLAAVTSVVRSLQ
jgi:pyrophosphatase PpaX